ncbi:hypothetical protein BgiMline_021593 [Biomphalaria glabrata]|nr:CAunnamed protein product; partial [Biomphalaria glabrata]
MVSLGSAVMKSCWIGPFGRGEDMARQVHQRWTMEGIIRKINIKTREWRGRTIVQGFQIWVREGGSRAYGMNYNDPFNTVTFNIPDERLISRVCIESDVYIHCLGFILDNGDMLGPVGTRDEAKEKILPEDGAENSVLCGISGATVRSEKDTVVADVKFNFQH